MFVSSRMPFASTVTEPAGATAEGEQGNRPTMLVIGHGALATALAMMAQRAGLHCLGAFTQEAAQGQLGWSCPTDHILLDLRGGAALSELGALASWIGDSSLFVLVDMEGLDHALAVLDGPRVDYLCDPTESEIVTMLVMAGLSKPGQRSNQLYDPARDGEVARLEQLSQDVRRLAVTIEQMSAGFGRGLSAGGLAQERPETSRIIPRTDISAGPSPRPWEQRLAPAEVSAEAAPTHAEIRALIRARRMRDQFFPSDMFADPAWDMMLDLMAARLAGQRVSVSSLCIAAAVPPTTALRWIRQLTDRAMFMRIDDPLDGRRVFIDLTETATQALFAWVRAVRRNGGLLAAG